MDKEKILRWMLIGIIVFSVIMVINGIFFSPKVPTTTELTKKIIDLENQTNNALKNYASDINQLYKNQLELQKMIINCNCKK